MHIPDVTEMMNNTLRRIVDGLDGILASDPRYSTEDYYKEFVDNWKAVLNEGIANDSSAEIKAETLGNIHKELADHIAKCIARDCPEAAQHKIMAQLYMLIETSTKDEMAKAMGAIIEEDLLRALFGPGN